MPTNEATALQPILGAITILGSGRLGPTLTALIALAGTVVGARALVRARRRSRDGARLGAVTGGPNPNIALVLGAISVVLGGLFLATADGGPGTGNGVVASGAALVLGPLAMALGGLGRARLRPEVPASG